jgi:hypothetical protein
MRKALPPRCACLHFPATCGDDSVELGRDRVVARAASDQDRLSAAAFFDETRPAAICRGVEVIRRDVLSHLFRRRELP